VINAVFISASAAASKVIELSMSQPSSNPVQPLYQQKLPGLLYQLRGGLIVSCQAETGEPLHGPEHMAAMAVAAVQGGAAGIRANTPGDIAAIRQAVSLPIIGIYKRDIPGYTVRITPTLIAALRVAEAGADLIAIDATFRPHPDNLSLNERIRLIHDQTCSPVMADISTLDEALAAQQAGADLVSTTLSGYTEASPTQELPDFELLENLVTTLNIPVVAEGHISTPEQAAQALTLGAFAVVVGSAITRPQWITAQFVHRMVNP
jgi:N-acylglucosamine-6-phosphate 2-epimerase